jgi:hypothetical protein
MKNKHKKITGLALCLTIISFTFFAENIFAQKTKTPAKQQKPVSQKVKKTASVVPVVEPTGTQPADINAYIQNYCRIYRMDPRLIYIQMNQESGFRIKATSYKGASGLMQLMPATARRFGVTNIYDPRQNIEAGIKYMRWLLDQFKDVRLALAGYNAGEGAVWKYGNRIPPYKETIQYVEKISYRYFGQVGHGTAFAWNLPLAVKYSQEVYGGRVNFGLIRQTNQSTPVYRQQEVQAVTPVPTDNDSSDKDNKEKEPAKRTQVELEKEPGRVPAASLFFFPKSNQK